MQQCQGIAFGLKFGQQAGIEACDAGFDFLDMPHQFVEDEVVAGGEVALQGVEDFLPAGFEPAAGQFEHLVGRLPGDDGLDHGARRLTMQIADDNTQTNPAVGQHLMQPVLLRGQLADQFLPLACDQAQFPQLGRRHKRAAQQTRPRQGRQPVGITYIRLAAGHVLDVPRIHHLRTDAHRFQRRVWTLPVNAGAFHHHFVRPQSGYPGRQFPTIPFETAKLPLLDARSAIGSSINAQAVICA